MKQTKQFFAAFLTLVMLFTSVMPTVGVWAYSEDTPNEWKNLNLTAEFTFRQGTPIIPGVGTFKYIDSQGVTILEGYHASSDKQNAQAKLTVLEASDQKVGYKLNGNDEVIYPAGKCFGIAMVVTMNTTVYSAEYKVEVVAYTNSDKTQYDVLGSYTKRFSGYTKEPTGIDIQARTYKTDVYNPSINATDITLYTNEPVEDGWTQGVTATQGKTGLPLNGENNWGEIKDTTGSHTEIPNKMVDGKLVFTGIGIHTHNYTVTDNSDKTTASDSRVITVKTKQAPLLTVRYTDTQEEYKGGWTNKDLDVELSTDIQGEYTKYLYKDNSVFGKANANEKLVKTINTTTRKNGAEVSGILESSNVKLSETSKKTVFVDKDKPTADIQFNKTTGLFTDNSNDISGNWPYTEEKSGVDKEKTMLAIVKNIARVPADTEYKKLSESAISEVGSYTVYYKVYDRAGNETTGSMNVTLEKEPVKYSVAYKFESATPDKKLPAEVANLLPKDENTYNEGVTVTAKNPTQTQVATEDGVWTFAGWDEESKVANSDLTFTGTWEFKVNEYKVTYKFASATADRQLPEEVTKLLPTDEATYAHGTIVTAKYLTTTSVKTADGIWSFQGWDKDSKVANSDLTFTGTWEFKLNEYTVSYQFKSGTENKELPQEVTALLPVDNKTYQHGSEVLAKQPEKLTVNTEDGVWTFKGWDADQKTATSDVIFSGTWDFKVNEYTVTYQFISATLDKQLPEQVKKLLPIDFETYAHGTNVTAQSITQTSVETNEGVWNFKSWDAPSKVATSNLTFTGTWEFKVNEYKVTYKFASATADRQLPEEVTKLLPTDEATYSHGTTVNAKDLTTTSVKTADGVWTFQGWDTDSKVATSDLTFTGMWKFKLNEYEVTYQFKSATENKELPKEVAALLPTDNQTYWHGSEVIAQQPSKLIVNTEDGVWTFKGWDADKKTATGDVTFSGTWEFKINEYKVTYQFTDGKTRAQLPEEIMDLLPQAGQLYAHGTKVVPVQPGKTQVNTSYGIWIFKGWSPQEISAITADVVFVGTWQFGEYAQAVNSAPTIKAENKQITVGDTFDPMTGVTATDVEDGDLTAKIQVFSNNVDVTKPGVYYVAYKVVDAKGAMVTKTVRVDVKEKSGDGTDHKPTHSAPPTSQSQTGNNPVQSGQTTNGTAAPQTGDYNNIVSYTLCFVICGAILVLLYLKRDKQFK